MNNSDNVIRGGLTSKHVDAAELKKIIKNEPFLPEIITPSSDLIFNYLMPQKDYSLFLIRGNDEKIIFPVKGAAVCIVTEGELQINGNTFKKGESFFISKDSEQAVFEGKFTLYIAESN
jgi:mannose-6-phosphate isomerase